MLEYATIEIGANSNPNQFKAKRQTIQVGTLSKNNNGHMLLQFSNRDSQRASGRDRENQLISPVRIGVNPKTRYRLRNKQHTSTHLPDYRSSKQSRAILDGNNTQPDDEGTVTVKNTEYHKLIGKTTTGKRHKSPGVAIDNKLRIGTAVEDLPYENSRGAPAITKVSSFEQNLPQITYGNLSVSGTATLKPKSGH